jgi:hypothetical protein
MFILLDSSSVLQMMALYYRIIYINKPSVSWFMPKLSGKQSIIGAVGGVLIGAAILLFTATMVLNAIKTSSRPATWNAAGRADWNTTNTTVDQLKTFLTVCTILLGILGIVLIGATIISAISGGFGGGNE